MTAIPVSQAMVLAAILFALGTATLLARRNLLFVLIAIEIMLNAAGLAFVAAGARWGQADGQVVFVFILATAAAEVSVGLGLALRLFASHGTLDIDVANSLSDAGSTEE